MPIEKDADGGDVWVWDEDDLAEMAEDFGIKPELPPLNLPEATLRNMRRVLKGVNDLLALPPPVWFIDQLVESGPVTVLHGESGTKKSFVLLDWMLCATTGTPWHGHTINPGKVLYVVAEGLQGMGKRVLAWCQAHDVNPDDLNITFMSEPLNLYRLEVAQVAHWRAWVAHEQYDYIVFDTLHMCSSGAEENSSKDMGQVFTTAKRIAGGARLFFAHHDPKEGKGARGSGAIRDDSDQCLGLTKTGPLTSQLVSDRQKDAGDFKPIDITFEIIETPKGFSLSTQQVNMDGTVVKAQSRRVDECMAAITEHDLDIHLGQVPMKIELHKLEYSFGKDTIGAALRKLRGAEMEVNKMNRKANRDAAGRTKDPS